MFTWGFWAYMLASLLAGQFIVWCADRLPARLPLWQGGAGGPAQQMGWLDASGRLRLRSVLTILIVSAGCAFLWTRYPAARNLIPLTLYWLIFALVTVIDLEHRLILNVVIYPAIGVALAGSFLTSYPRPLASVLGGVTGFVCVYAIYLAGALFARTLSRRRGRPIEEVAFGAGDVRLAVFIGLVTGLPGVIFALVIGIFVGGVIAAFYLGWNMLVRRRYVAYTAIPYGPFLVSGGLLMMLYGQQIVNAYIRAYAP